MCQINKYKMKTFKDLMQEERHAYFPPQAHTSTPAYDPYIRNYNNLWGMMTDSHMEKHGEDYIIFGSVCATPNFMGFITQGRFEGISNYVGYANNQNRVPFYEYMYSNGYVGEKMIFNGDIAFRFYKRPQETIDVPFSGVEYNVGDSRMPQPIRQLGENVIEKLKKNPSVETLNEDFDIKGNSWKEIKNDNWIFYINEGGTQHKIILK